MSKLSADSLRETIAAVLEGSKENPRKFTETIELQISVRKKDLRETHESEYGWYTCESERERDACVGGKHVCMCDTRRRGRKTD